MGAPLYRGARGDAGFLGESGAIFRPSVGFGPSRFVSLQAPFASKVHLIFLWEWALKA